MLFLKKNSQNHFFRQHLGLWVVLGNWCPGDRRHGVNHARRGFAFWRLQILPLLNKHAKSSRLFVFILVFMFANYFSSGNIALQQEKKHAHT